MNTGSLRFARATPVAFVLIGGTVLAARQPTPPATCEHRFTVDDIPRISGSTSTQPITTLAICHLFGWKHRWSFLFDADSPRMPWPEEIGDTFSTKLWPRVRHHQTHQSYVDLITGKTDLVLVAREPSSDERQLIATHGVVLESRPIALDALVFAVNDKNPISNLRLDDVREIYSGTRMMWKAVGGDADRPVVPLIRNRNSGSHELFLKLVMGDRAAVGDERPSIPTMQGLIDRVGSEPDDLGYSLLYYVEQMIGLARETRTDDRRLPSFRRLPPPPPIKLVAIDGVIPSKSSVADGSYRLREPVLSVMRRDAPANARRFRDWLVSAEGQKMIEESGYVAVP